MTWVEGFQRVYEQLDQFLPAWNESRNRQVTSLNWGENEWKLFYAFNFMRKKVTPVLRKIHVGYETYIKWIKSLESHCTIHTGFYPQGYPSYTSHCFLFYTDFEESVKSLFSLFPTTSFMIELEKQLLVFAHVLSPNVKRNLICLIYDMKTKKMIKGFKQVIILSHSHATQLLCGSRNY